MALLDIGPSRPGLRFAPPAPLGLVLHSTATPGATAAQEDAYFETHQEAEVSCHLFCDDKEAVVSVPLDEIAYHAGATANRRYLGLELCEFPAYMVRAKVAYERWVNVAGYVCALHEWVPRDKDTVWSHAAVSEQWHESDHTDPLGYLQGIGVSWENVLNDVTWAAGHWAAVLKTPG